jgi:hypothetical protein
MSPPPATSNLPETPEEETAHADDRIIARGVRFSLSALLVLGVLAAALILILKHKPPPAPAQITKLSAPSAPERPQAEVPLANFKDITAEAGITFKHVTGAYGAKLLPETMGGGVAFFDYDNDGYQDLLFINSNFWPEHPAGNSPPRSALYHNDGHGHFTDVTQGCGLDVGCYGMGVAIGDYDNDGLDDVLITAVGGCRLFHNEGHGKFREVTSDAGVGGSTNDWSTAAAFFDYDNDGKLDLFVGNYVKWSREIDAEVGYKIDGRTRAYGPPMNFAGAFPHLYHNEGGGHFREVTDSSGLLVKNPSTGVPTAKTLGIAPIDINGDGWIDLVVANDTTPNLVFINQHDGTFKEIGAQCGVAFDSYGNIRGAMGIDAADYRNDGKLGIAIGNFANEMTALYVAQNSRTNFADEAITEGVGPASRLLLKFGVFFFDYDLDGRLDLLSCNGHLEEEISKIQQSQRYRQPAQLFWNAGEQSSGCFVPVSGDKAGADLFQPMVGRGAAFADIDGDGDPDIVLTQVGGSPLLLRNDQKLAHHYVRLKLVGTKSNRDAIGAWVTARVNGRNLSRQVMPTHGYLSQSELPVTFGLGKSTQIDSLEIRWSGGAVQKVGNVPIDQTTVITEPR